MLQFPETVLPRVPSWAKYGIRSSKFIWAQCAQLSCTHWLRPRNAPPHPHLGSYTRALLVSQDRRHLFVTPWFSPFREFLNFFFLDDCHCHEIDFVSLFVGVLFLFLKNVDFALRILRLRAEKSRHL
jgi:hypothetical protein